MLDLSDANMPVLILFILGECCAALWKLETSHSKEHNISLQELLLTPQYESKPLDHRIKIKELFTE